MDQSNQKKASLMIIILLIAGFIAAAGAGLYFFRIKTPATITKEAAKLKIAGAGAAVFAITPLAEYYEKKNSNARFDFLPIADATIGIRGAKEKILDIGLATRLPKPEEEYPEMVMTQFAKDAVAFVVNKSVKEINNITGQQIADIYTGKITNWSELGGKDEKIIVLDREEAEPAKKILRNLFLKQENVTINAIEVHSDKEMLTTLLSSPNSIGYMSYGRAKTAEVIILSLNGVEPGEGMGKGIYPMEKFFYAFTRIDSSKEVKDFVSFIDGEGKNLLEQYYFFKP